MHSTQISFRIIFLFGLASVFIALFLYFIQIVDKSTSVVFCDVGQGDAIYMRIRNQMDILIDAGPDKKVLACLGRHMPFFDRTIELAFLSHPQHDHYGGYKFVLERYEVKTLMTSYFESPNQSFQKLKVQLQEEGVDVQRLYTDDLIQIFDASIHFLWPTNDLFKAKDPNYYSQIYLFSEKNYSILFTGDAVADVLNRLSRQAVKKATILKVPHHGSKHGLSKNFLMLADPDIAVISSGKNNPYGHPSKFVLDMLKAQDVKIRRTDKEGDIVFKLK